MGHGYFGLGMGGHLALAGREGNLCEAEVDLVTGQQCPTQQ